MDEFQTIQISVFDWQQVQTRLNTLEKLVSEQTRRIDSLTVLAVLIAAKNDDESLEEVIIPIIEQMDEEKAHHLLDTLQQVLQEQAREIRRWHE